MSALLDTLLDKARLADIARNDALAGFPPAPPVELDEFFARCDMAMLALEQADGYSRTLMARGLEMQQSRLGAVL